MLYWHRKLLSFSDLLSASNLIVTFKWQIIYGYDYLEWILARNSLLHSVWVTPKTSRLKRLYFTQTFWKISRKHSPRGEIIKTEWNLCLWRVSTIDNVLQKNACFVRLSKRVTFGSSFSCIACIHRKQSSSNSIKPDHCPFNVCKYCISHIHGSSSILRVVSKAFVLLFPTVRTS